MASHYHDQSGRRPERSNRYKRLSYGDANRTARRGKHSIGSPSDVNGDSGNLYGDSYRSGSSYDRGSSSYGRGSRDSYSRDDYAYSQRPYDSGSFDSSTSGRHARVRDAQVSDEAREYSRSAMGSRYTDAHKPRRKKKIGLIAAIVLVVILAAAGVAGAAWYMHVTGNLAGDKDIKMTEEAVSGEPYYVLLLGGDSRADSKEDNRTDSIMVARVDEAKKSVSILSVPRDLRVNIDGHGMCKINSAIEYGGYDGVINEVNQVLGIKINYYAFIYFSGFKDLVDQLGGVTVDVPEGTYYHGTWVPSGENVQIDGTEALVLARCRHGNPPDQGAYAMGDYQRTLNQRNLIKAIAKKILKQDATQYPALIASLSECVETNMSVSKLVSAATNMKGFDTDSMQTCQLPVCGDVIGGAWYAAMYEDVFQVMRDNFVNGRDPMKGLDGFNMENNDNDLTSYCTDGELYAYTSYADMYGSFQ